MNYLVMLAVILVGVTRIPSVSAEDGFNRLFTTPEQRKLIDEQRQNAKSSYVRKGIDSNNLLSSVTYLSFDALLKTEKGYSIWINGRLMEKAQKIEGIWVDPERVINGKLSLVTDKGIVSLALGQVYWVNKHRVLEKYASP